MHAHKLPLPFKTPFNLQRSDQALGVGFVSASVLIFAYYFTWTLLLVRALRPSPAKWPSKRNGCAHLGAFLPPHTRPLARPLHAPRIAHRAHPPHPAPLPRCASNAQPFLPPASPLRLLFPLSREWAVWIPATACAGAITVAGLYVAYTLLTAKAKAPPAAAAAAGAAPASAAPARLASAKKAKQ
jgi:hypothetical protein